MVFWTLVSSLVLGLGVILGANRLYFDRRPDGASPDFLLNEGLLLLALVLLQAVLIAALTGRLVKPLQETLRFLSGTGAATDAPGTGDEIGRIHAAATALLQKQESGRQAIEELERVRSDAVRMREALSHWQRSSSVKIAPTSSILPRLCHDLDAHLGEIREWREENGAVALQIRTGAREAVLAMRDSSAMAETSYLEASELAVTLRELSRLITEIRPVLEADIVTTTSVGNAAPGLQQVCKMLTDVADRYRWFALRISRDWALAGSEKMGPTVELVEDLARQLEYAERERGQAERLLAETPARAAELRPQVRAALKKLLQSAEIAHERLTRLTAVAEKTSSTAQRATSLAERELQSLEALGVRLSTEGGPEHSAETLGESDFVVDPER